MLVAILFGLSISVVLLAMAALQLARIARVAQQQGRRQ